MKLRCFFFLAGCVLPSLLQGQQPGNATMARALELERQNQYAAAADAFKSVLAEQPGDPAALLGVERVLEPLDREADVIPLAQRALVANPSPAAFGVLVRGWVGQGEQDSAQAVVERWALAMPGELQPWRDWVQASLRKRDRVTARRAVELARRKLKNPAALAYEAAQLYAVEGDWASSAREWTNAIRDIPGYRLAASAALAPAPVAARPGIRAVLRQDSLLDAQVLAALLGARWGDPQGAVKELIGRLPPRDPRAVDALNAVAEQLRVANGRSALLARGAALEAAADRSVGVAATRALVAAARSYQEAGDAASAQRILALVTSDRSAGSSASETLIDVLVGAGRLEEAERRFAAAAREMNPEDRDRLRRRLAWGWATKGDFARAAGRLEGDSTVDGLALRGRIAIFQGDLKNGADMLRKAGPYAGSRTDATERTALLALLQPIEEDSLPALGAALLALARGDTLPAAASLEQVANGLPAAAGGAELRLLAGRLLHAGGESQRAEALLRAADTTAAPAVAPVAELELAHIMIAVDRSDEARTMLEHLILTYPASAVVPEARRALDTLKGTVPPS